MANKKWKLWLDDVRNPRECNLYTFLEDEFIWAPRVEVAQYYCFLWGPPEFVMLGIRLGVDKLGNNSIDFLRWLAELFPNSPPPDYSIHTSNPEGGKNMKSFMESWHKMAREFEDED